MARTKARPPVLLLLSLTAALACTMLVAAPGSAATRPQVRSLSVTTGSTSGGTSVTIRGTGFRHVKAVLFGRTAGSRVRVISSGKLVVIAPPHAAGRVHVRVVARSGTSPMVSVDRFTYVAPPRVASVSPTTGSTTGGTRVKVTGSGFVRVAAVRFGASAGTALTVASPTVLYITTPAHAQGQVDVRVTTAYGVSPSAAADRYTYVTLGPTINVTSPPAALSNNSTPSVSFTTTGNPVTVTCRADNAAPTTCTSPYTTQALPDGDHTISITATDAANNETTVTTASFTIDTLGPTITFTSAPPAQWPVNYFDVAFTTGDAASVTCSLNGAAFSACSSPRTITTSYGTASTFSVRATDVAGNPSTKTTSWTANTGLVLHLPWEGGSTTNTSLLSQVPGYSPSSTTTSVTSVGGWAGTAITNAPAHNYDGTVRPLSSSPNGAYTLSLWMRTQSGAVGTSTILDTLGTGNAGGLRVTWTSGQVNVSVGDNGTLYGGSFAVPSGTWHQIALRTKGPAKGLQVFLDGQPQLQLSPPVATGFGAGQRSSMQIGPFTGLDLDDLRIYNVDFSDSSMCTVVARGRWDSGTSTCAPLVPGIEYDFERSGVVDSGSWSLPSSPPATTPTFVATETGFGIQLATPNGPWGVNLGLQPAVAAATGRSLALWVSSPNANAGVVWDSSKPCTGDASVQCGIKLTVNGSSLDVRAVSAPNVGTTATVALPSALNRVLVVERRTGADTQDVRVYVNGTLAATIPIGTGDVYAAGANSASLVQPAGVTVDEYELWPVDLTADPEMLCENGFDGEYHPAAATCVM